MKNRFIKILSLLMTLMLFAGVFTATPVYAKSASEIQAEIDKLKEEKKEQQNKINSLKKDVQKQEQLKTAIEKQMSLVQKEIDLCNRQIGEINSKIAANKAEIDAKNAEIESDKLAFKKRLRAIQMSKSDNNVQILLGAEDFSDFLQLSQLTASVSARDKRMIEDLVAEIGVLEEKQKENDKLLEEQKQVKSTISARQNELKSQNNEIQSVISSINADKKDIEAEKAQTEKELKEAEKELAEINKYANGGSTGQVYDGGSFLWPTPSITTISSYYGQRWGRNHNGVDISNGTWGAKIIAISDGVVTLSKSGCSHNYRKTSSCGCGGGYGNYVIVDHGKGSDGKTYAAWYAHMSSVAVSEGQSVKKGDTLGYVGCTGRSTGPHLHFGLKVNGSWVNPMSYYTKVK